VEQAKQGNKLRSRKLWITVWAMGMLTVGLALRIDLPWFSGLAPMLGAIPIAYMGANAVVKGKGNGE